VRAREITKRFRACLAFINLHLNSSTSSPSIGRLILFTCTVHSTDIKSPGVKLRGNAGFTSFSRCWFAAGLLLHSELYLSGRGEVNIAESEYDSISIIIRCLAAFVHFDTSPLLVSTTTFALLTHKQIPAQRWTQLTHRRLQAHPSTLTKNNTLLAAPLPAYLVNPLIQRFKELELFDGTPHQQPNHVLINEYKPGEGIMPHEDGGAYAPVVATVSLGGSVCLEITPKPIAADERPESDAKSAEILSEKYTVPTRIFQEPRSLLLTTGEAYRDLVHGIAAVEVDEGLNAETVANWSLLGDSRTIAQTGGTCVRETRVSLTYRDVLKVSSAASKVFGGFGRR
jgi:alkylated DNA repair protein alkB family protein 6